MLVHSSMGRPCRVCRAAQCSCGGPTTSSVFPIDITQEVTVVERQPVYEYDVTVNGHDTIMNLTEDDATRLHPGAKRRPGPVAPDHPEHATEPVVTPSTKARTAANK